MTYKYEKRNGNGQSTCHLCNKLTWDSFCYNFYVYVINKLLCKTILCDDCIYELKKEVVNDVNVKENEKRK